MCVFWECDTTRDMCKPRGENFDQMYDSYLFSLQNKHVWSQKWIFILYKSPHLFDVWLVRILQLVNDATDWVGVLDIQVGGQKCFKNDSCSKGASINVWGRGGYQMIHLQFT